MLKQNTKIFIVDDEPMLIEMLTDYLLEQNPGLIIKSFSTGEECLKCLYENPDIVVLDYYLNLKEKDAANGIDILKDIKKWDKKIPVIMLSSQKSFSVASQTIMFGAVHYVIKGENSFNEIYELIKANV